MPQRRFTARQPRFPSNEGLIRRETGGVAIDKGVEHSDHGPSRSYRTQYR